MENDCATSHVCSDGRYWERAGRNTGLESAAESIVSLPLFPDMTVSDVDYVCSAIKEIIGS